MSEDQKKPVISKMPGPLPGLGGKLGGNPLPGLGGTPGAGPLPGLGARPSAAPLPGMKPAGGLPGMGQPQGGLQQPAGGLPGMKPMGGLPGMGQPQGGLQQPAGGLPGMKPMGGLPGMPQSQGAAQPPFGGLPGMTQPQGAMQPPVGGFGLPGMKPPAGAVPPFMQQPQAPEPQPEPEVPVQIDTHDPFGKTLSGGAAQVEQFIMPSVADMYGDSAPRAPISLNTKKTIINFAVISAIGIVLGIVFGTAASSCKDRNMGIRDALIVDYELKDNAKLFNELKAVIDGAVGKASRNEVDEASIAFLKEKILGSPVKPGIVNERDFKNFGADCMKWMAEYSTGWDRLYALIREHRLETTNDMDALKGSNKAGIDYGVIFKFDNDGNLSSSVGVLGAPVGGQMQIQSDTGSRALKRTLYTPQDEKKEVIKDPGDYLVKVGDGTKNGLLKGASEPHFVRYTKRLKAISELVKSMADTQKNLLAKFSEYASQSAAPFVKPNPEKAFQLYLKRSQGGGESEEGAAGAEAAKKN